MTESKSFYVQELFFHSITLKSGDHIGWLYNYISNSVRFQLGHCLINIHNVDPVPLPEFGADTGTCPCAV